MWNMFVLSVLTTALVVYLPGACLMRAARFPWVESIVFAPLVTIPIYEVLCIVYSKTGVFTTWGALFWPLLAVGIALGVVSFVWGRRREQGWQTRPGLYARTRPSHWPARFSSGSFDGFALALYLVLGIAAGIFMFACALPSADAYYDAYDNIHHIGQIRLYVETGNWTPLTSSLYVGEEAVNPLPGGGFYPSGWHCLVAMAMGMTGAPTTVALNAVNFLFASVVYPLCLFLLMRTAFQRRPWIAFAGSVAMVLQGVWPWTFLIFGPLYPNLAAFCMVPAVAAALVWLFAPSNGSCDDAKRDRLAAAALFVVGCLCMLFVQPNGVFTAGVFAAPYIVYRAGQWGSARTGRALPTASGVEAKAPARADARSRRVQSRALAWGIVAAVVILAIWTVCFKLPPLQGVVWHDWPAYAGRIPSAIEVITLRFHYAGAQPMLMLAVLAGLIFGCRHRNLAWVLFPFVIACGMYFVDVTVNGWFQHFVCGFWYADSYRVAAFASMFAIPVAAMGLYGFCRFVWRRMVRRGAVAVDVADATNAPDGEQAGRGKAASAVLVVCMAVIGVLSLVPFSVQMGQHQLSNTRYSVRVIMQQVYASQEHGLYTAEKREFVRRVESAVPVDALILNEPNDGSAFAWAIDGLNVYYRYARGFQDSNEPDENESPESRLVRGELNHVADDPMVRDAVHKLGAVYVIQFDSKPNPVHDKDGNENFPERLWSYEDGRFWRGIDGVDDDTPGFEVVLAQGNMRLYRITE